MGKGKRILGVMLAVVMTLALVPAMAFGNALPTSGFNSDNGKITVENVLPGHTYKIYQVLKLESWDDALDAYAYKVTSDAWYNWFKDGEGKNYAEMTSNGYVTWRDGSDKPMFAKAALAFVQSSKAGIEPTRELTVPKPDNAVDDSAEATDYNGDGSYDQETTTITFEGLNLGYYLLDSSAGTLCSLDTTAPDAKVVEKNGEPTVDKRVLDPRYVDNPDENEWCYDSSANVGDKVSFRSFIMPQPGAQNYILHDVMDPMLSFNKAEGVKVLLQTLESTETDMWGNILKNYSEGEDVSTDNYTLLDVIADDCTFEVVFKQSFCDTLTADNRIVVEYSATLGTNAKPDVDYLNTIKLSFGENSRFTTEPAQTETYTCGATIWKCEGEKGSYSGLAGAEFSIQRLTWVTSTAPAEGEDDDEEYDDDGYYEASDDLQFVVLAPSETEDGYGSTYRLATADEIANPEVNKTDRLWSGESGLITILGLSEGSYQATELKAPDGHNMLSEPVFLWIGKYSCGSGNASLVINKAGIMLPSTGGIGTTIFYICGGVLIIGALAFFIMRRRFSARQAGRAA